MRMVSLTTATRDTLRAVVRTPLRILTRLLPASSRRSRLFRPFKFSARFLRFENRATRKWRGFLRPENVISGTLVAVYCGYGLHSELAYSVLTPLINQFNCLLAYPTANQAFRLSTSIRESKSALGLMRIKQKPAHLLIAEKIKTRRQSATQNMQ